MTRRAWWLLAGLACALPTAAWLPRLVGLPAPVKLPLPPPFRPPSEAELRAGSWLSIRARSPSTTPSPKPS